MRNGSSSRVDIGISIVMNLDTQKLHIKRWDMPPPASGLCQFLANRCKRQERQTKYGVQGRRVEISRIASRHCLVQDGLYYSGNKSVCTIGHGDILARCDKQLTGEFLPMSMGVGSATSQPGL